MVGIVKIINCEFLSEKQEKFKSIGINAPGIYFLENDDRTTLAEKQGRKIDLKKVKDLLWMVPGNHKRIGDIKSGI